MSATDFYRKKQLDNFTGVAAYTPPARYLSLHVADPTESGSHAHEVSGVGYARLSLTGLMGAADLTGFSVNTSVLVFGPAGSDWGTIPYFAVEDSGVAGSGNMLWPGAFSSPRTITSGQPFQIPIGRLRLRMT